MCCLSVWRFGSILLLLLLRQRRLLLLRQRRLLLHHMVPLATVFVHGAQCHHL